MSSSAGRLGLGLLTGLVALAAMVRLVAGAFSGPMTQFAWAVTLVAMAPWVVYLGWRARRARLGRRAVVAVVALDAVGLAVVAVLVVGPVLALALSFAASAVLWVADRPLRGPRGADRYVRVEELGHPVDDEDDQPPAG